MFKAILGYKSVKKKDTIMSFLNIKFGKAVFPHQRKKIALSDFSIMATGTVFTEQLCPPSQYCKVGGRVLVLNLPLFHCILGSQGDLGDHLGQEYPAINKRKRSQHGKSPAAATAQGKHAEAGTFIHTGSPGFPG